MAESDTRRASSVLLAVALLAVVAGWVGAVLPVDQAVYTHRFTPTQDSIGADGIVTDPAMAPLALAREVPDRLHLVLPCEVDDPGSRFLSMHVGLWRSDDVDQRAVLTYPDMGRSLSVTVDRGIATVTVRSRDIVVAPIVPGPGCAVTIDYEGGRWTVDADGSVQVVEHEGPRVTEARFTGPAATHSDASVTIETRELGSSPTPLKLVFLLVATGAVLFVARGAWQLATGPEPGPRRRLELRPLDLAVFATLGVWAIFIPLDLDDGWVTQRVGHYSTYGDIAGIFTAESAPMPFGYWVEWLQHLWHSVVGGSALLMRLPAAAIGAGTWLVVRRIADRLGIPRSGAPAWILAGAFVTGAAAWGTTVRVEPVMALLMAVSVLLALRFRAGPRGPIAVVWLGVIALALSAHPAGLIAVAPLLATWRSWLVWVRSDRAVAITAGALLLAVIASVTVLLFLDSNVATKADAIEAYRTDAHSLGFLDEPDRYRYLDATPYATPMRRLSVMLVFLGLGAFALGWRRARRHPGDVVAWSVLLALVLVAWTPSKWPSHLGGLTGVAAVLVAFSVTRLERRVPSLAFGAAAVAAGVWVWTRSLDWAVFDLRVQEWSQGATNLLPFDLGSLAVWLVLTVGVFVAAGMWGERWSGPQVIAVISIALVASITAATLAADTLRAGAWTFGGQNLESLVGAAECGLGDELMVPVPGSLVPLRSGVAPSAGADTVADAAGFDGMGRFEPVAYPRTGLNRSVPVEGMGRYGSYLDVDGAPPDANTGSVRSQWHAVAESTDLVGLMVLGSYVHFAADNAVGVQWGRSTDGAIEPVGIDLADDLSGVFADWRLVTFRPPADADRVRLLLRDGTSGRGDAWVASSTPLGLTMTPLPGAVATSGLAVLASPAIGPYFPCVTAPAFQAGVVPAPGIVLQTWSTFWETTFAGAGVSDRYFRYVPESDPPLRSGKVGAHSGDVEHFMFFSQEYLTGVPARATGAFVRASG